MEIQPESTISPLSTCGTPTHTGAVMSRERTWPFLLLPLAMLFLTCAGVVYWWPAITPGLRLSLHFSETQADILVAVAGSGSTVGILGGLFHSRYGTRATGLMSAVGLSLCFTVFAGLTLSPPLFLGPLLFPLCVTVVLGVVTFAFMLYTAGITSTSAVFPPVYRGRVVGLCSAAFGGSAGFMTAIQTALFPALTDTSSLLLFTALLCLGPAFLAFKLYPRAERFDQTTVCVSEEEAPLLNAPSSMSSYIDRRLRTAYSIAWVYVAMLQGAAVANIMFSGRFVHMVVALVVVLGLAFFVVLHFKSSLSIAAATTDTSSTTRHIESSDHRQDTPFISVLLDPRYLYECLHSLVLAGGGGIAFLVLAPRIVEAHGLAHGRSAIAEWVRALVAVFSAFNITARLIVGAVMDRGATPAEGEIFKFRLLHTNALIMGVGLALLTAGSPATVIGGAALVGLSYGSFFCIAAALTTVWFGLRNFPRNFACIGPFIATGTAVLASGMPIWLRSKVGTWSGDGTNRVCDSPQCVVPALIVLVSLQVMTFLIGLPLWPRVRNGAGDVRN